MSLEVACYIFQESCAASIDWYISVQKTQGSVEESSFGQMKNINEHGSYTVGVKANVVETQLANVIKLRISTSGRSVQQSSYTLDELRDLESKLVLITGRDSKEKGDVYQFINVSDNTLLWNSGFKCVYKFYSICS